MAIYTLSYVQRDGNPRDIARFSDDLGVAIAALETAQSLTEANSRSIHWMIYDADDPERGYFDRDRYDDIQHQHTNERSHTMPQQPQETPCVYVTAFGMPTTVMTFTDWVNVIGDGEEEHALEIAQKMLNNPGEEYEDEVDQPARYYRTFLIHDLDAFKAGAERLVIPE